MFLVWTVPEFRNPANTKASQQYSEQAGGGNVKPIEAPSLWDTYTSPKDTYAQWIAAIAAIASVGASVLAIVLVARTLNETRKATNAAVRSSEIAERMLLDVERPHLFIENVGAYVALSDEWFDLPEDKIPMPEVNYTIKNYGRTPAIVIEIRASARFGGLPEVPHYHPGEIHDTERVIAVDEPFTPIQFCRTSVTHHMLHEMWLSQTYIEGRTPIHFYFYGQITYKSVSGLTDQIGFIYRYLPHGQSYHLENIPGYTFRRRGEAPQNG
ncbi:hypothetical protein [Mesorhizobium sp.]|uniref:hypothetical protein n=1 Tax=Mesorhizobium sp. TaxID=1871066 RepID=UPI0012090437|nr:hypothetical protein [Mesorhizobium sp.]TIS89699.1 MAG: hypothetical protein E5W89_14285 [Mesorhizobium sp.]